MGELSSGNTHGTFPLSVQMMQKCIPKTKNFEEIKQKIQLKNNSVVQKKIFWTKFYLKNNHQRHLVFANAHHLSLHDLVGLKIKKNIMIKKLVK